MPIYLRHVISGNEEVRVNAAWVLGICIEAKDQIGDQLLDRMENEKSPRVRESILFALDELGQVTSERLTDWMKDPTVRVVAALVVARGQGALDEKARQVLEQLGPEELEALEHVPWLDDGGDALNRLIVDLNHRPDLQVSLLTEWMKHEDAKLRYKAVFATKTVMHTYRPAAQRLVPEVSKLLKDPEGVDRARSIEAP